MPSIAESLREAVGAHQAGDLPRAEKIYRDIVRVDPKHADALHLLGLAAHQRNRHADAIDYISRAIQSNDSFAPYYGNLGVACQQLGNREQAVQCFQKALELDPQFADAYFNLATVHFDASNWDKARECYERGLEINGDDPVSWQNLGMIHEKQHRINEAIDCYRRVLELDPQNTSARHDIERAQNQTQPAPAGSDIPKPHSIDHLLDLTPPPPMKAEDYFLRGEAHLEAGQFDEAIESLSEAIEMDPAYADAYLAMGNALKRRQAEGNTPGETHTSRPPVSVSSVPAAEVSIAREPVRQTNISPEDVLNHLERAIRSTPTIPVPFPHVYYENMFPDEFYWQMIDHLPETRFYEQLAHRDAMLPNGESARRVFSLEQEAINTLPGRLKDFWTAYAPVFHSGRTVQAIFSKFGHPPATVPLIRLYRDLAGYKILPHPDIPEKQATTQFYLPRDRERLYLGTCLYEQDAGDPEQFHKVKQFAFAPNTGYSFQVSETSWHGVEESHAAESPRDSIMIIYHDPDKLREAARAKGQMPEY